MVKDTQVQSVADASQATVSTMTEIDAPQGMATTTPDTAPTTPRLLGLPPELRNLIYDAYVQLEPQIIIDHGTGDLIAKGALHRVCTQIRDELGSIYQGSATELVILEEGLRFTRTSSLIKKLDPRTLSALCETATTASRKSKMKQNTKTSVKQQQQPKPSDLISRLPSLRSILVVLHVLDAPSPWKVKPSANLSDKSHVSASWFDDLDNSKKRFHGLRVRCAFTTTSSREAVRKAVRSFSERHISWRQHVGSELQTLQFAAGEFVVFEALWSWSWYEPSD